MAEAESATTGSKCQFGECRQGPSPGRQRKAYQPTPIESLLDMPCDPEQVIRKQILQIVEYLSRIQEK